MITEKSDSGNKPKAEKIPTEPKFKINDWVTSSKDGLNKNPMLYNNLQYILPEDMLDPVYLTWKSSNIVTDGYVRKIAETPHGYYYLIEQRSMTDAPRLVYESELS